MSRFLIDATPVSPRLKGTGRFILGLVEALPSVAKHDDVAVVTWPAGAELVRARGRGVVVHLRQRQSETLWEVYGLGRAAKEVGADVVLTLRELVGFGGPPTVLHLAEPPALRLGQHGAPWKHRAKNRLLAAGLRGSLRRAAAVTASSDATADWVEGRGAVRPRVIPPGVDSFFLERTAGGQSGAPFLLHPATGDARDNTALVLAAYAATAARRSGVRLALTGTPSTDGGIRAQVRALGLAGDVDLLGWVSDAELRERYAHTVALVHPTAFEGFAGLQVLEAMAQGAPVIALEGPGVSGILNGAAEMITLPEASRLTEAIDHLHCDEGHRIALGERGRRLAAGFTWGRTAEAIIDVMRSAAERLGRRPT